MQTRLTAGDAELTISPEHGCRIEGLRIGGTEVLRQGERFGSFPMVPWCGRTENGRFRDGATTHQLPVNAPPHAIHGTVRDLAWKTARVSETEAVFTCELGDPWPYKGRVTQVFELAEDSLTLRFGVETYDDSFPAQASWHPGSCATSATAARTCGSTSPPAGRRSAARTTSPPAAGSTPSPARGTTASACPTASTSPSPGRRSWS